MKLHASETTAIAYRERTFTFNEVLSSISYFSSLSESKKPEKIAIYSENRPEWIYILYAGWRNNAIVVPIDYMSKPEEAAYILNDSKPEILFYSTGQQKSVDEILPLLQYEVFLYNIDEIPAPETAYPVVNWNVSDPAKTAVIIYTSGTTGSPKGVMLSFDNLMMNVEAVTEHISIFRHDRPVLALLPFHHILPLLGTIVMPFTAGATIAFTPSLQAEDIINTLQRNKVAVIIGVPRFYEAIRKGIMDKINKKAVTKVIFKLAKALNSQSFSKKIFHQVHEKFGGKVEFMVCGGAKLTEFIANDYKALGFEMLEGFGMTEAAPMITFTRPGRWKIGSAGEAMPGVEMKSLDGEIVARGRNIMQGYYNKPEATAEILKDGWLHTGDLGHIDVEGFIHITGRLKEIIVLSNGKNINPEEIEVKLKTMSGFIAEVAVFQQNDSLSAVIYPDYKKIREEGSINIEEMFRWNVIDMYNKHSASYKKLSRFYISKDELPKTRLGKIQRYKLAASVQDSFKKKHEKAEPGFQEYIVIRDYLKEQKKADVFPDDHFEIDLSLDSLDKVNFQVFLESTFGIKISDDVFNSHPTVEKLSQYMKEKKNKLHVEAVKWAEILKEKTDFKLPKSVFTHNIFKNISKMFFKLYFRIKSSGAENIPEGPVILAPNHQSFFDGLFVSMFLKKKIFKETYFYAKEKHVRNKLVRALADTNNVIVMDLNKDLKESLQKLAAVLKEKKNIIIFPEGTRTYSGTLGEFKKFFAILSLEFNVPVVPVSIKGAIKALPRGSFFPRPWKKIDVKFHKPVYPKNHNYESLTDAVYQALAKEVHVQ